MVTGNKVRERIRSGRWPCGCHGRGVGANCVVLSVTNAQIWGCRTLYVQDVWEREGGYDDRDNEDPGLVVNGAVMEEVEQFWYLWDLLDCEAGVERAVIVRVTAPWSRWWEIASLMMNHSTGLRTRDTMEDHSLRLYKSQRCCIRSLAVLKSVVTLSITPLTSELE